MFQQNKSPEPSHTGLLNEFKKVSFRTKSFSTTYMFIVINFLVGNGFTRAVGLNTVCIWSGVSGANESTSLMFKTIFFPEITLKMVLIDHNTCILKWVKIDHNRTLRLNKTQIAGIAPTNATSGIAFIF